MCGVSYLSAEILNREALAHLEKPPFFSYREILNINLRIDSHAAK